MSLSPPPHHRRRLRLPPLRSRSSKPDLFTSLPAEIRRQIYAYYFADSYIRYHRRLHIHHGKPTKRAHCHGPHQIALLLTCRTIYHEALPILQCALTLLIDRTEAFAALRTICTHIDPDPGPTAPSTTTINPFPPLLSQLTHATRQLILSKIQFPTPHAVIPAPRSSSTSSTPFPHLHSTTLFGVYPHLDDFLRQGAPVTLGSQYTRWPLVPIGLLPRWCCPLLARRPHRQCEVDLDGAVPALHALLGRAVAEMGVKLHAWCSRSGGDGQMSFLEVRADLDDVEDGYEWAVLSRGKMGRPWHPVWPPRTWPRFERETLMRKRTAAQDGSGGVDCNGKPTSGWMPRWGSSMMMADDGEDLWLDEDENEFEDGVVPEPQQHAPPTGMATATSSLPFMVEPDNGSGGNEPPAKAKPQPQPQPQPQRQEPPRRDTISSVSCTGELAVLLDKGVSEWATITDSGDWQSVRSGEVAFKQWDAALEQSWAAEQVLGVR